jgi:hypothetical protein
MWPGRSRTFQQIFPLILLGMILMRLIWMQLRVYPPEFEHRAVASLAVGASLVDGGCAGGLPDSLQTSMLFSPTVDARDVNLLAPAIAVTGVLLCRFDQVDAKAFVRVNQFLFCATILCAVMLARFVTSSWMLALIVAAMLFSRGMLLADIGAVSSAYMLMFLLMLAAAAFAHFFRTGSRVTALVATAALAAAGLVDRALWFVPLVPLFLLCTGWLLTRDLFAARLRQYQQGWGQSSVRAAALSSLKAPQGADQADFGTQFARLAGTFRWFFGMEFEGPEGEQARGGRKGRDERAGGLFKVLGISWLEWIYSNRRWLKLATLLLVATMAALLVDYAFGRAVAGWGAHGYLTHLFPVSELLTVFSGHSEVLMWSQLARVDMHLIVSFFIMVLCAVQQPRTGLPGFFELAVLLTLLITGVAVSGILTDIAEYRWAVDHYKLGSAKPLDAVYGIRTWLQWVEPLILTMGVVGFYNLMKVLDTRFTGKSN